MAGDSFPGHGSRVDVAVVGSLNVDLIARIAHPLHPGETVLAEQFGEHPGGKGLNQAVAAARIASTALLGAVGGDEPGRAILDFARSRGVDVASVSCSSTATGRALITLLPDGENTIVVAPLANMTVRDSDVAGELERRSPAVALVQFEIPADVITRAAEWTASAGARLIVNPSPMRQMNAELVAAADPLVVNVGEAKDIVGTDGSPAELAQVLSMRCRSVVVTAGPAGAVIGIAGETVDIPSPTVDAVADSSGAGDALAGTLAAHLALGVSLADATRAAVEEAARIVGTPRSQR